jgi:microcystin degradation protein MlrC
MPKTPRIAIGGFMLESNWHAPVSTREEFAANVLLESEALLADLRLANPKSPRTLTGFVEAMEKGDAWERVPLVMAAVGASGPVEQEFFDWVVARTTALLRQAGPVDAVFLSEHGAATATRDFDPDATLFKAVRDIVGSEVPIVATLDLHANVSQAMVDQVDVLVSYRTNPHVDQAERGADCARHLRALLGGMKAHAAFRKLPLAPPQTAQLTKSGPYHDILAFGQERVRDGVIDVSVTSGFSLGDTPKNGMSVIVSATTRERAESVAREVAIYAWSQRARFTTTLTPLEIVVARAAAAGRGAEAPLCFADVADNPGGGGRGNTTYILKAFVAAGVAGCTLGPFYDPELAAEAHRLGVGAAFTARFNRSETTTFSEKYEAPARVVHISDGRFVGRRGGVLGRTVEMGPSAAIAVGGVTVVVTSIRHQAIDPRVMESVGIDLARQRSVVVKSRGHFRAAFDEFFPDERIIEVDVPGLTTPIHARIPWQHVIRPIYPLDPETTWEPS